MNPRVQFNQHMRDVVARAEYVRCPICEADRPTGVSPDGPAVSVKYDKVDGVTVPLTFTPHLSTCSRVTEIVS